MAKKYRYRFKDDYEDQFASQALEVIRGLDKEAISKKVYEDTGVKLELVIMDELSNPSLEVQIREMAKPNFAHSPLNDLVRDVQAHVVDFGMNILYSEMKFGGLEAVVILNMLVGSDSIDYPFFSLNLYHNGEFDIRYD